MNDHHDPRKKGVNSVPIPELLSMARGRWVEILTDAGVPSDAITDDRRGRSCPRCGGRDRFALLPDFAARGVVMCRHCFHSGTAPRPGDGLATLRWWLGASAAEAAQWLAAWLRVGDGDTPDTRRPIERSLSIPADAPRDDRFAKMSDRWFCAEREGWRVRCAELLGFPAVDPLLRLRTGWTEEHKATSWPMCDASGHVIGIRLRCPKTARKWAVTGSRAGLFMPEGLAHCGRRLFVCEGPTDTAALLSVGLDVIGVPSAGGGSDLVADVVRKLRPAEAVIVADGDGPGRAGAEKLAETLMMVRPVRLIIPPAGLKDARAWVASGAGRDVIEAAADAAPVRRPSGGGDDWPDPIPIDRPDLPRFPAELLPDPLRAWVNAMAEAAQVPADLPALLGLAVCAGAVARRVEIEPWRSYREPLNLYAACLLDPANRKSSVFRDALAPLRAIEAELIEAARPEVARTQSDRRMREIELKKLEAKAAAGDAMAKENAMDLAATLADEPVPQLPRLLVDDATAEAVELQLAAQGGRLVVAGAEGGVFDTMAGRYSSGVANIDCFLKGHAGDDLRVDRVGRGAVVVDRCCLTLAYAVQPEVIRGMTGQKAFRGRGLIGRFLYALPASRLGLRRVNSDPVPERVSRAYGATVRRLFEIPPEDDGPAVLRLSPDAAECFRVWAVEVEAMLGPDGRLSSMPDWGGKLVGLTARLAGLIHLLGAGARDPIAMPVGVDAIESAVGIGRWAIPHAEASIALMVADDGSSDDAGYVMRWLQGRAEPKVTRREIHQHGRARFDRDPARLDRALAVLIDRGWLRAVDGSRVGRGRPSSDRYRCHPRILNGPREVIQVSETLPSPMPPARVKGVI